MCEVLRPLLLPENKSSNIKGQPELLKQKRTLVVMLPLHM